MVLYRWTAALIAAFVLIIAGVNGVGAVAQNPVAALFTNPDGVRCAMPCLFGMHLSNDARNGITIDAAVALLRAHPLTRLMQEQPSIVADSSPRKFKQFSTRNRAILIWYESRTALVDEVDVFSSASANAGAPDDTPALELALGEATSGEIVRLLGAPTGFDYIAPTGHDLYYEGCTLAFLNRMPFDGSYLRALRPSVEGTLKTIVLRDRTIVKSVMSWRGFTTLQHYWTRSTQYICAGTP